MVVMMKFHITVVRGGVPELLLTEPPLPIGLHRITDRRREEDPSMMERSSTGILLPSR
jgi:hypothetical protein